MAEMTEEQIASFEAGMKGAGIKDLLVFANTEDGRSIVYRKGNDQYLQKVVAGFARKHEEILVWMLGVIRLAVGAKTLNISVEKLPPEKGPGAEA